MRATAVLALALLGLYVLLLAAVVWFAMAIGDEATISELPAFAVFAPFTIVGTLVALRQPRNPVGWLLDAAGLFAPLVFFCELYAVYGLVIAPGSLPLASVAAWLSFWVWMGTLGSLLFAVFLFPTGQVASPRWKPDAQVSAVILVLVGLVFAFGPDTSDLHPKLANPLGIASLRPLWELADQSFWVFGSVFGLAVASVVQRFRRASGVERQQLKWAASGFVIAAVALAVGEVAGGPLSDVAWILAMISVPLSIGIAILRSRLYDIDVLINRTLVYGATSVALLAVYVVALLALQLALRQVAVGSELAIAGSTLAIAGLVQPARTHIQRAIDRRFYRAKYDAQKTLDAFAYRLRDQVDLDELRAELLGVVHETIRPAHASLWLRQPRG
jgi:hypothetical protein